MTLRLLFAAAGLLVALSASGQTPLPPLAEGRALTLMDAVELALRANPTLRLAEFTVDVQAGVLQETRGQFDPTFNFNATTEYRREPLTQQAIDGQVQQRQDPQTAIDLLAERIASQQRLLDELVAAQGDPSNIVFPDPDIQAQLDLINTLIETTPDGDALEALLEFRQEVIEQRRNDVADSIEELRETQATERERIERLGAVPTEEISISAGLDATYRIPYRNGSVASMFAELNQSGGNFADKPQDPAFGGRGQVDLYRSRIGVRLEVPLGQGSGRDVVAAFERSAELGLDASRYRLVQQAAATVSQTAFAYWNLVGAQMNQDVLGQSVDRQRRLLSLVDVMIQADLLPAVERGRALAQLAEAEAALVGARNTLREARLALADQIGLQVDEVRLAPMAADAFPAVEELERLRQLPVTDWVAQALEARGDQLAAELDLDAARVLENAAARERRYRHDLQFELSSSGLEQTSSVPEGIEGSLFGRQVGPSASVTYSFSRPQRNDLAIGQYRQAEASRRQAEITAMDLARRIRAAVIDAAASLVDASEQADYASQSMDLFLEAIRNERDKVELGTATVIDLVLTEERLTFAQLSVIAAQQRYASQLINLRFATGSLVDVDEEGFAVEAPALVRPPGPVAGG